MSVMDHSDQASMVEDPGNTLKRYKKWLKFWKLHRFIPPDKLGIVNFNQTLNPYKIIIKSLENIKYAIQLQAGAQGDTRYLLRLHMNTFSKEKKKPFGRTFKSHPLRLKMTPTSNTLALEETICVYFLSRIDKNAEVILTIEAEILEMSSTDVVRKNQVVGYCEINIHNLGANTRVNLKKGSPWAIMNASFNNPESTPSVLIYDNIASPNLLNIKSLIPENILCGSDEVIPGIGGKMLPNSLSDDPIPVENSIKVFLTSVQITVPEIFEQDIIRHVDRYRKSLHDIKDADANLSDIYIKERKLVVVSHNGWTAINSKGFNNYATVSEILRKEIPGTNRPGQEVKYAKVYEYSGMLDVDCVYIDDDCLISLQLDYTVIYSVPTKGKQTLPLVISWMPHFLSERILQGEYSFNETMLRGPGITLSGQKMIEFSASSDFLQIQICSRVQSNSNMASIGMGSQVFFSNTNKMMNPSLILNNQMNAGPGQYGGLGQSQLMVPQANALLVSQLPAGQQLHPGGQQFGLMASHIGQYGGSPPQTGSGLGQNYGLGQQYGAGQQYGVGQQYGQGVEDNYSKQQLMLKEQENRRLQEELNRVMQENQMKQQMNLQVFDQQQRLAIEEKSHLQQEIDQKHLYEEELKRHMLALRDETLHKELLHQKDLSELKQMMLELKNGQSDDRRQIKQLRDDQEPVLVDRIDKEKWKVIDSILSVPRNKVNTDDKAFLIKPEYGMKDLSRADKAYLLEAGIKGLLDDMNPVDVNQQYEEEKYIRLEIEDKLKASIVLIQFLALRPSLTQGDFGGAKSRGTSIYSENFYIPERIFMTLNFYDFPLFKTESIAYENYEVGKSKILSDRKPLVLVKEAFLKGGYDFKEPVYKFEIDPSVTRDKEGLQKFVQYLYKKSLHIDIWDAETMMLYGTVKVPLRNLMRQGRPASHFTKEFDIIEPGFMRIKGGLQVLLKNVGKIPAFTDVIETSKQGIAAAKQVSKKKVKSSQPLQLPKQYINKQISEGENEQKKGTGQNEDVRKQERIKRFKMTFLEKELRKENPTSSMGGDLELKQKLLNEISNFKSEKKPQFIKGVLTEFLSEERILNASFGKAEVIPFEFVNQENTEQAYVINIDDPDMAHLSKPELSVVNIPSEWKFWVEKKGFDKPPEWEMISPENVMILAPREKCTILFKFLSFRKKDPRLLDEKLIDNLGTAEDKTVYIRPRIINVFINVLKGRVITGFGVRVQPQNQIVDHVFRYFERENRAVELQLPALYYFSQTPLSMPILHATYGKDVVKWIDERQISIHLKTLAISKVLSFNLLAYEDSYYGNLMGNWIVEVHSLAGVDVHLNMGQLVSTKLTLQGDVPRMCRVYSSHPLMVYFPAPFDKPFSLIPGKYNVIETNIKSFCESPQIVQINCVDINSKELVYAWSLRIDTGAPNVTRVFEITAKVGTESIQKFVYQNKSSEFSIFEFTSSHPDVLQVIEPRVQINGGEKESIKIKIPQRYEQGMAEVFVFANDKEDEIFECLLFKIKYTF